MKDNLVKGVQCYELFGGITLKIHTFSFFIFFVDFIANALKINYQGTQFLNSAMEMAVI